MSDRLTISIVGCARCHGEGHEDVEFEKLTFSIELPGAEHVLTHWAPCPTNGEPILMAAVEDTTS